MNNEDDLEEIENARAPFKTYEWKVSSLLVEPSQSSALTEIVNPANPKDIVGSVIDASAHDVETAIIKACAWSETPAKIRAQILNDAADLYEKNFGQLFSVLAREAGKTPADAIGELREAVDFLRYYAAQSELYSDREARGVFTCISPWNFPLAIFTGQVAAALAAGNGVLAKPAETTPITATLAVKFLHQAGVPLNALQLLHGRGAVVGAKLVAAPRISGVCFTGSTFTAQTINKAMSEHVSPTAPLIAETGGLNAMIVDTTALPEQAIKDIIASSFQSAGQRCSALRVLYLQEDIAPTFMEMLYGAMDELVVSDPWEFSTDVGPVIDKASQHKISTYIETAQKDNRILKQLDCPSDGTFIAPTVIQVQSILDLEEEIFGPVLHVATFKAQNLKNIIDDINASGFGLTFGLHTRIDERVQMITSRLKVGNMYVNRNQIGAIVGSQPFGGEGLSGTGPKAGGPNYVKRFTKEAKRSSLKPDTAHVLSPDDVQTALSTLPKAQNIKLGSTTLPGPTGESNVISYFPRGAILCLGPTLEAAEMQAEIATRQGCPVLIVAPGADGEDKLSGYLAREHLSQLNGFSGVACWSDEDDLIAIRQALASRLGPILPLLSQEGMADQCTLERHVCIDTTAAGGNAALLASTS